MRTRRPYRSATKTEHEEPPTRGCGGDEHMPEAQRHAEIERDNTGHTTSTERDQIPDAPRWHSSSGPPTAQHGRQRVEVLCQAGEEEVSEGCTRRPRRPDKVSHQCVPLCPPRSWRAANSAPCDGPRKTPRPRPSTPSAAAGAKTPRYPPRLLRRGSPRWRVPGGRRLGAVDQQEERVEAPVDGVVARRAGARRLPLLLERRQPGVGALLDLRQPAELNRLRGTGPVRT